MINNLVEPEQDAEIVVILALGIIILAAKKRLFSVNDSTSVLP